MTAISEREQAWSTLYAEMSRRFDDERLDGPWELGHRTAIRQVEDPVDLVVRLTGYTAGLATRGLDTEFVRQKIDDALALVVKYG